MNSATCAHAQPTHPAASPAAVAQPLLRHVAPQAAREVGVHVCLKRSRAGPAWRARGIGTSDLEPGAQGDPEPATAAQQTTTDEHPPSPETFVMLYDIAPATFDLGVNQQMEIYAYYNSKVRAHMLSEHLTRKSGQLNNWKTVNQPFLEALRKRLLGWRSQKAEHQQEYCQRGDALFANVQAMPLRNVS